MGRAGLGETGGPDQARDRAGDRWQRQCGSRAVLPEFGTSTVARSGGLCAFVLEMSTRRFFSFTRGVDPIVLINTEMFSSRDNFPSCNIMCIAKRKLMCLCRNTCDF